ncbi:hypothetical protein BC351_03440 [Paenibacillus ferrarius]|uniref:Uncharacterized protein n=1 Tax=Paenibacillus ferrarius TaxID=1469647 RepID=A0A1V4HKT0_9BACL|nr:aminoglycoside 6-adenylyltransferase [Paenibacillus ferrarius]OPH57589.1 hypothetical protein BC351_03440 [Paenibacillus ferrarius]
MPIQELLDEDQEIQKVGMHSDAAYVTKKPAKENFEKAVNEILWCSTNTGKGLWRDELPYAKYMFDVIVRKALIDLAARYIGMQEGWQVNTGLAGRWFKRYLGASPLP